MASKEELVVKIGADLDELKTGLNQAGQKVDKFGKQVKDTSEKSTSALAKLTSSFSDLKVASLAAAASAVIWTKSMVDAARETKLWADRIDISTQSFSELAAVGRRFGAQTDDVGDAIKDLNERIADAARGNKTYEDALRIVGLRSKELINLPIDQQFIKVADAIGKMNNAGDQNFVTAELMADAGFRLLEMFRQGEGDINKFRKEVQLTGEALSSEQIQSLVAIGKNLNMLTARVNAFAVSALEMNTTLKTAALGLKGFSEFLGIINTGMKNIVGSTDEVAESMRSLGESGTSILTRNLADATARMEELKTILGPTFDESLPIVSQLNDRIDMLREKVKSLGAEAGGGEKEDSGINKMFGFTLDEFEEEQNSLLAIRQAGINALFEAELDGDMSLLDIKRRSEAEKTKIQEDNQKARIALSKAEAAARLSIAQDIFGNLSTLMNSESRKMFEVGKAAAIAQATISTYEGASKALAKVPYPFNFAAAASVVAAGIVNIQRISSTTMGGGGGGGVSAGGAQGAEGGARIVQENVIDASFNIEGTNVSKESIRGVFSDLQEYIDDGARLRSVSVI